MAREQRYIDMKGDDESEPNAGGPTGAPAAARWGFMSGFCGADSMPFAAQKLGGTPVAGFDVDETVQRLWSERTGIPCWGEFSSVLDAAADGLLDDLASSILIYLSTSAAVRAPISARPGAAVASSARRAASGSTIASWGSD